MKYTIILSLLLGMVCMTGCGEKVPDGFPEVFSCKVVVNNGGSPIEGASVILQPTQKMNSIIVSGKTDATGTAEIRTLLGEFSKTGAPAGDFTVKISKTDKVDIPELSSDEYYNLSPQERAAMEKSNAEKIKAAKVVPDRLSKSDSPIKVTVDSSNQATVTVDVSEYK